MLRVFLFFLLLFLWFPCSGCYARHYAQEPVKLLDKTESSDAYTWNFGQVKEGQVLKHDFTLKNESAKPMNIKHVNTSCGCTVSQVKKKNLLPGESTLIEVKFDTKGYSGPTQQFVYVHTDNLDNLVLRFIIKADIIKK